MTAKQAQITSATIRLFSTEGLAVPTAKIAKEAGVSNDTMFNYFATKQALYNDLYLSIKEDMAEHILCLLSPDLTVQETLWEAWRGYATWSKENPLRQQAYMLLKTSRVLSEETIEKTDELFQYFYDKMEEGVVNKDLKNIPTHYLCELTVAHLNTCLRYSEAQEMNEVNFHHQIKMGFDIFWDGIKA
ncbi:MAG: TetR/AcrR family transcriptional regulator [Alphaproteobacteria bacterium]|nr:TetR/AcrR family transcriptional regulator [Alphaproteobacteria bacterium]